MFNVKHNECVGFESRWIVKKVSYQNTTQTTEFEQSDAETNTASSVESSTQTDLVKFKDVQDVDMERLAEFLRTVYPAVVENIEDGNNSKAFQGYSLFGDTIDTDCKIVQTINVRPESDPQFKQEELRVSAISWNSTGHILGVACNFVHSSWCCHSGNVWFYELNHDGKFGDVPLKKVTADSCVTVIAFHPTQASIVAGGSFSGGVVVWNIQQNDGDDLVATIMNAHEIGLTQISWINHVDSIKTILLATSSLDSFLCLWNFNPLETVEQCLTVKLKYKVKSPIFGILGGAGDKADNVQKVIRGIVCFDFSRNIPDMFVVGAEGGLVVQCSVQGAVRLKGSTNDKPMYDPTYTYYVPHKGEITAIKFSPNRKEMFMTSGTDNEIRIYLIGQEEPAQIIFLQYSVLCVQWVPFEELLFATCGAMGVVEIFNLKTAKPIENIMKEKVNKTILTEMAINNNRSHIVAIGNDKAELQLWKIPWNSIRNMITN